MFRGNSDACVSATVAILTIKKTTLLMSFYLIVFKGNRSAYVNISAVRKQVTEESMPIDDLLIQISDDLLLPITTAEVTMIRLGAFSSSGDKGKAKLVEDEQVTENHAREIFALICRDVEVLVRIHTNPKPKALGRPSPLLTSRRRVCHAVPALAGICSDPLFEEFPSVLISSDLLVQADEGVSLPVVDLIDESTTVYREEPVFL
ncbi:WASH complex subunit 7-like [Dorcoceras hygrometricum]|uniref:WASH complex subunit 7-like n=1 Tax=Dorcoceras hygrometricum TaxID=472368 RepID=A0A2Z7BFR4_9LAMI|nr:WASH complex subunit 7-like [Dorcoceras hygrometricum]